MPISKIKEFAKNGQKSTEGIILENGFPIEEKPARQWFNYLFNSSARKTNEIIDVVDLNTNNISTLTTNLEDTKLDTGITAVPTLAGQVARTQNERNSDLVSSEVFGVFDNLNDVGIKAAISYAVSNNKKIIFNFDATIKVPTHAANISDAIHSVASIGNRKFTVLIEAGHVLTSGVNFKDGDYSNFTITSEDAVVPVSSSFAKSVISAINAKAATLGCLVDLNGKGNFAAYNLTNNSSGYILEGAGVLNGTGRGLYVNQGSTCTAIGAVFTGFGDAGCHVSRTSELECANANFDNNGLLGGNFGAVYASRNSQINGADMSIQNSGGVALRAQRMAVITAPDCNASGATSYAVLATLGGKVYVSTGELIALNLKGAAVSCTNAGVVSIPNAVFSSANPLFTDIAITIRSAGVSDINGVEITGFSGTNVYASESATVCATSIKITGGTNGLVCEQGAVISARGAVISATTQNCIFTNRGGRIVVNDGNLSHTTGKDISCSGGSWINAKGCQTTTGVGTPNIADTNVAGFNFFDNGDKGFIWV